MSCFGCFGGRKANTPTPSTSGHSSPLKSKVKGSKQSPQVSTSSSSRETSSLSARLLNATTKNVLNDVVSRDLLKAASSYSANTIAVCLGENKATLLGSATEAQKIDRVVSLQLCLDASWVTLIETLEPSSSHNLEDIQSSQSDLDWSATSLKGIQECFYKNVPENTLKDICFTTHTILEVFALYQKHHHHNHKEQDGTRSCSCFCNESLNKLMKYVAITLNRTVTQLSQGSLEKNKKQFGEILQLLGLGVNLQYALDPNALATLVYLLYKTDEDEKKLVMRVHRAKPFQSAFESFNTQFERIMKNQNHMRGEGERCKIFPQFYDELCATGNTTMTENGEGHGPRKELFDLVSEDLTSSNMNANGETHKNERHPSESEAPLLFQYNRSMGCYWFNLNLSESSDNSNKYFFVGWLMAQTLFNRTKMRINLAGVIFERLLRGETYAPSMETLAELDPEAFRSVKNIQNLSKDDFEGMLELEGKNGMSKDDYINECVHKLLLSGVQWQFDSLCRGFHTVMGPQQLKDYFSDAKDLSHTICGENVVLSQFDVRETFLIVYDDELKEEWTPLSEALWDTIDSWSHEKKLLFVKFVTGSNRLPLPQTETLKIELPFFAFSKKDHTNLLKTLPQAHTCENLLELPNYWESLLKGDDGDEDFGQGVNLRRGLRTKLRKILDERLTYAIENCHSYGLDTLSGSNRIDGIPSSLHSNIVVHSKLEENGADYGPMVDIKHQSSFGVSNDEIEYLSHGFEDDQKTLVLTPLQTQNYGMYTTTTSIHEVHPGEWNTPRSEGIPEISDNRQISQKPQQQQEEVVQVLHDTTIDEMVDELGIEL